MADQGNPVQVEPVLRRELGEVVDPCSDVDERSRPATAARADAAELEVPGRIAVVGQIDREPVHQVAFQRSRQPPPWRRTHTGRRVVVAVGQAQVADVFGAVAVADGQRRARGAGCRRSARPTEPLEPPPANARQAAGVEMGAARRGRDGEVEPDEGRRGCLLRCRLHVVRLAAGAREQHDGHRRRPAVGDRVDQAVRPVRIARVDPHPGLGPDPAAQPLEPGAVDGQPRLDDAAHALGPVPPGAHPSPATSCRPEPRPPSRR